MITRALVLIALSGMASAETRSGAAPLPPDPIADEESSEANLESKAPRDGYVVSLSLGAGLLVGGDIGVGRGGSGSIRIGHVATRHTVITFELTGTGAAHRPSMTSPAVTDTNVSLYAGALRYATKSTWVRMSGGLTVFTPNNDPTLARAGLGGLVGGGLDLVRWGYVVLGLEVFGVASATGDGFKLNTGFMLGLTYY